jgi:CDP-paratose 2-epimerase
MPKKPANRFNSSQDERMSIAIITGSAGLIASEAVRFFSGKGFTLAGIDNDISFLATRHRRPGTGGTLSKRRAYRRHSIDIRDSQSITSYWLTLTMG